jgi:hypothetical protein
MNFNWPDFLEIAQHLLNDKTIDPSLDPARFRIIISRAYYAAFQSAQFCISEYCGIEYESPPVLKFREKYDVRDHGIHGLVPKLMMICNDDSIKTLGGRLETLRINRVHADYKISQIENIARKAEDAIKYSGQIIKSLDRIKEGSAKIDIGQSLS